MHVKPNITGTRHVLAVNNIQASIAFYTGQLGFSVLWHHGDWAFLTRDAAKVMLGECPGEMPAAATGCHSYIAYIEVTNIDELYSEYRSKQVNIGSEIEDKPWGQREFSIKTIDGHRVTFGESKVDS